MFLEYNINDSSLRHHLMLMEENYAIKNILNMINVNFKVNLCSF